MPNTAISGGRELLLPKLECHYDDGERRNGRSFVSVFMLGAMKVSPSPPPPPQSMSYTYRFLLRCCMHCWWVVGLVVVGDVMDRQGDKHLFFHISCCSPLEILYTDGLNGYIRSSYWLAGYAACPAAPPDDGDDMHEARI